MRSFLYVAQAINNQLVEKLRLCHRFLLLAFPFFASLLNGSIHTKYVSSINYKQRCGLAPSCAS